MERVCFSLVASAAFAGLLLGPSPALAQTPGSAESFAVLGGTAVTVEPPRTAKLCAVPSGGAVWASAGEGP